MRVQAPREVLVPAAHPVAPWPLSTAWWHREVGALAAWAGDAPTETPLVMAGDFNAGHGHPVFRRLLDTGLHDAHRQVGAGPVVT